MIGEILLLGLFDMIITQVLKKWVKSKLAIHLVVLAIAIIIGLCSWYSEYLPQEVIKTIVGVWIIAIGAYEILIKRIGGDIIVPIYSKVAKKSSKKKK